jgi:N-glycosylase/DNA lyase
MNGGLVPLPAPDFDLALSLGCGQVFHWRREGAGWIGAIRDRACYAEQAGDVLHVTRGMEDAAARYFALDHPLEEIRASFPEDAGMTAATAACRGLRIVRQPAWECVATFITSSMKQVPHIARISHTLRERYGKPVAWAGGVVHAYPEPAALAVLEEDDLRDCALGYRAKTLLGAARKIASGEVRLEDIAALDDDAARVALCALPGVGVKVANCALLFAFERLRAFPIDVWIERVLIQTYFPRRRKKTPAQLKEFASRYFGPYGGYAQQYLFHHARTSRRPAS